MNVDQRSLQREAMYESGTHMSMRPSRAMRRGDMYGGIGGSPSKPYINSISQPPSARGSPISSRNIMVSPTHGVRRGRHYGISRSSNNSPLTLPVEHVPQSLSTSSAYGHGFPYYDDPGSPIMDTRAHAGIMHAPQGGPGGPRTRSGRMPLRSYHSMDREPLERDYLMRDPRDRRDRSLDRNIYLRDEQPTYRDRETIIDDPYRADPHRAVHSSLGHSVADPRHYASRDSFVMELQARLNELQSQYGNVKRELDATTQKLGSSMHSIKTFWSPELKKERALRKEEAAKYALINDQLKILRSENQELELRIETQKQTLAARDESIKKLMEMMQNKGIGSKMMEEERMEIERLRSRNIELETRLRHTEHLLETKEKELIKINRCQSQTIDTENIDDFNVINDEQNDNSCGVSLLKAVVEIKDSRIRSLEQELDLFEWEFARMKDDSNSIKSNNNTEQSDSVVNRDSLPLCHLSHHKCVTDADKEMEELKLELNKRDQEILAVGAKMKTLEEQHLDYQRHISVLKESLCAKEEHYNMLQADVCVEELRTRLEEKNKLIEKKTQQTMATTQDRNKLTTELQELKDHIDIKDRKVNVLQRKIENLEDLLKEKDNQVDMARARLTAMQAHHSTSEGALSTLEDAISDKDKQIAQIKEQRDRAEQERNEERDLHERQIAEYKMKLHALENEMEKLQRELQTSKQQMAKGIQQQTAQQNAELAALKKQLDDRAKSLEETEKKLKKRQSDLDQMEVQLQNALKQASSSVSEGNEAIVQDLRKKCDALEKDKSLIGKEMQKAKEESKTTQSELDRLLKIMSTSEEEKFALNRQIQELQNALRSSSQPGSRRNTQSAQTLEESRRGEPSKQQQQQNMTIHYQNERIEELEEALRESVRITAQRESEMEVKDNQIRICEEKINQMAGEMRMMKKLKNATCTNCPSLRVRLDKIEAQLSNVLCERHQQLNELFDMKLEALSAAISEKDAHLAVLEMSGVRNGQTADEVERLRLQKRLLVDKLKNENESRVKLLYDTKENLSQLQRTSLSNSKMNTNSMDS